MLTAYSALPQWARTSLIGATFLLLLFQIALIIAVSVDNRRAAVRLHALPFPVAGFFLLMRLIDANDLVRAEPVRPIFGDLLGGAPWSVIALCLLAGTALSVWMLHAMLRHRKTSITPASVKESADDLPTALCFSLENGLPLLVNREMSRLALTVTGRDLQDAGGFWGALTGACPPAGTERVSGGAEPIFRLADGGVWMFQRREIRVDGAPVHQITAADVTYAHELGQKLREKNAALAAMNARLRRYSDSAVELTREEEILAAKTAVHDNMGRALLATRYYLTQPPGSGDAAELVSLWRENIALLRHEARSAPVPGAFAQLRSAARAVGAEIELTGVLPQEDPAAQRLIVSAARECLTNAVRHAGADRLFLRVGGTPEAWTAELTNNGAPPQEPVAEGGGLSGLRRRVESAGGTMEIRSLPAFALTVTIPKERGDDGV